MNNFTKKDIRAVRDCESTRYKEYWVHIELFIDGDWFEPYFINEELPFDSLRPNWYRPRKEMYPSVEKMQEFIKEALERINKLLGEGWKLVSYDEFKQVVSRNICPLDYTPKVVTLI